MHSNLPGTVVCVLRALLYVRYNTNGVAGLTRATSGHADFIEGRLRSDMPYLANVLQIICDGNQSNN